MQDRPKAATLDEYIDQSVNHWLRHIGESRSHHEAMPGVMAQPPFPASAVQEHPVEPFRERPPAEVPLASASPSLVSYHKTLAVNKIRQLRTKEPIGKEIADLLATIRYDHAHADFSGQDFETYLDELEDLEPGSYEVEVVEVHIAWLLKPAIWRRTFRPFRFKMDKLMPLASVPYTPKVPPLSQPKPDILVMYNTRDSSIFTSAHGRIAKRLEDSAGISPLPFLVVEIKGTSGAHGTAVNQMAGSMATCLNTVTRLKQILPEGDESHLALLAGNCCFGITMVMEIARVFVGWQDEGDEFLVKRIGTYDLELRDSANAFRRQYLDIMLWARSKRLEDYKAILGKIDAEAVERAKLSGRLTIGRPPPIRFCRKRKRDTEWSSCGETPIEEEKDF